MLCLILKSLCLHLLQNLGFEEHVSPCNLIPESGELLRWLEHLFSYVYDREVPLVIEVSLLVEFRGLCKPLVIAEGVIDSLTLHLLKKILMLVREANCQVLNGNPPCLKFLIIIS